MQPLFDPVARRRARNRAAPDFAAHDFLFREIGERLLDRLGDVRRDFPVVLDLGCRTGLLGALVAETGLGADKIGRLIGVEPAAAMAAQVGHPVIVADEGWLPLAAGSVDLVLSNLSLQGLDDPLGALIQARRALRPDGLLLAALFGGETLLELRQVLLAAEAAVVGGAAPRIAPAVDSADAAQLLQRAGFALPVVDSDRLTVTYPDAFALMRDLRGMGETNILIERLRRPTRRAVFLEAAARYQAAFGDAGGRITASFQVIFMTGWAPAPSQPLPAARGSASHSLRTALADDPPSDGGG